ncbi:caspase-3-like [Bradysia coprophila]|uniref:caspase-3-like n=1 Tax=Bradysia coprophila TaxID=38358 RepID=UPI00187D6EF4|nr:caspase-3-like [Bradysia coprophila]
MSNPNTIRVGSDFKGVSKGKINYGGKNSVTTNSDSNSQPNVNIGSTFEGTQEVQSEINFAEENQLNVATQEHTDQKPNSESSEPSTPKVNAYKLEPSELKDLGFSINGHMTIFNQEFKNARFFRAGSSNDVEYLTTTFRKLGIEPSVKPDLKYKDIVKEIEALSTIDFSTYKLFVCVYMSHGHKNGFVSAADKEFNLRNTIIDPIMGNKSLNGIPKIFITVACRGEHNYEESDSVEFDGHITSTANGIDYSNCIISYSTYEGHVSKRKRDGTYFIQSLCDNINEDNGNAKIHSLFAKVNGKLAEMYKQVPVFETSMGDISFKDLASASN